MSELKELICATVTDLLFGYTELIDVEVIDVTFNTDKICLASIELLYQNECVSSDGHKFSAPFCTALCYYSAAIFVDAVRETISKALVKGKK